MKEERHSLKRKPRSQSLDRVKKMVSQKTYYLLAHGYADYRFEDKGKNWHLVISIHDNAPEVTNRQAKDFYRGLPELSLAKQSYVRTKFSFNLSKKKHPKIIEALNNAENPKDIIIEALNEYLSK